ncbi:hypothetical protein INR49_006131 [Caranx melampygus]|nr:hypothetical protein INR49_006131 [Caranx melampygus]
MASYSVDRFAQTSSALARQARSTLTFQCFWTRECQPNHTFFFSLMLLHKSQFPLSQLRQHIRLIREEKFQTPFTTVFIIHEGPNSSERDVYGDSRFCTETM